MGTECSWFGGDLHQQPRMGSVPARQQPQRHPAEQPVAIERAALSVAVGQSVVRADLERNGANDQSAVPVLWNNQFDGEIPVELAAMPNLEWLALSNNSP